MGAGVANQIRFAGVSRVFAPRPIRMYDWFTFPTIISLLAGLLTNIRFQFVGLASVGETVLAVVAVFAVSANLGNLRFWKRPMLIALCALGVSFLGYMLSDLVNSTPHTRLIRGWARMAFLILDFISIWALTRNSTANLFALCVGDALSTVLSYFLATNHEFFSDYKFHFAVPITLFVILAVPALAPRGLASVATGLALSVVGTCHFILDNRLVGAICILIGFVLIARAIAAARMRSLYLICSPGADFELIGYWLHLPSHRFVIRRSAGRVEQLPVRRRYGWDKRNRACSRRRVGIVDLGHGNAEHFFCHNGPRHLLHGGHPVPALTDHPVLGGSGTAGTGVFCLLRKTPGSVALDSILPAAAR